MQRLAPRVPIAFVQPYATASGCRVFRPLQGACGLSSTRSRVVAWCKSEDSNDVFSGGDDFDLQASSASSLGVNHVEAAVQLRPPSGPGEARNMLFDYESYASRSRSQRRTQPYPGSRLYCNDSPETVQDFTELCTVLKLPDEEVDVLNAALLVSRLSLGLLLVPSIDALTAAVSEQVKALGEALTVDSTLNAINQALYENNGFKGQSYYCYNHDNYYVDKVLELKRGNPTCLAILYLAIARRLGLTAVPVSMPSYVFLLVQDPEAPEHGQRIVDPYKRGQQCTLGEIGDILTSNTKMAWNLTWDSLFSWIAPNPNKSLLLRLVLNLKELYWTGFLHNGSSTSYSKEEVARHLHRCIPLLRMLRLFSPLEDGHVADEALCLRALGRTGEARELLQSYLEQHPESPHVARVWYCIDEFSRLSSGVPRTYDDEWEDDGAMYEISDSEPDPPPVVSDDEDDDLTLERYIAGGPLRNRSSSPMDGTGSFTRITGRPSSATASPPPLPDAASSSTQLQPSLDGGWTTPRPLRRLPPPVALHPLIPIPTPALAELRPSPPSSPPAGPAAALRAALPAGKVTPPAVRSAAAESRPAALCHPGRRSLWPAGRA